MALDTDHCRRARWCRRGRGTAGLSHGDQGTTTQTLTCSPNRRPGRHIVNVPHVVLQLLLARGPPVVFGTSTLGGLSLPTNTVSDPCLGTPSLPPSSQYAPLSLAIIASFFIPRHGIVSSFVRDLGTFFFSSYFVILEVPDKCMGLILLRR